MVGLPCLASQRAKFHVGRLTWADLHSFYRKGLPGSVPKMEETVGPVSTCGSEQLRG